jgi:tetratricopeptide (TPR) repeat protein
MALQLVREARHLFPEDMGYLFKEAWILFSLNRYDLANNLFTEALRKAPDSIQAQNGLAMVTQVVGNFEDAIQWWLSQSDRDICLPQPTLELAECYMQTQRYDEAKALLIRLSNEQPRSVDPYLKLKTLWELCGEPRRALSMAIKVARLSPAESLHWAELVSDLAMIGRDCLVEKRLVDKLSIIQDPNFLNLLLLKFYHSTKQLTKLEQYYNCISQDSPIFQSQKRFLRTVLKSIGRIDEANHLTVELGAHSTIIPSEFLKQEKKLSLFVSGIIPDKLISSVAPEFTSLANDYTDTIPFPRSLAMLTQRSSAPAIKKLISLARNKEHDYFLKAFDESFVEISAALSNSWLLSSFLLLKAQSHEALGHTQQAINALQLATQYGKNDRYLLRCYQQMIKRLQPVPIMDWMNSPLPLISITSSKANMTRARLLADRIKTITNTPSVIIYSDPAQKTCLVTSDTLVLPGSDDYIGLPLKLINAFQFYYIHTRCKSVLKIDDDVFIKDSDKFKSLLSQPSVQSFDYLGEVNHSYDAAYHFKKSTKISSLLPNLASQDFVPYCDGGFGYYLSRKALRSLFEQNAWHPHYLLRAIYEDVLVGELLQSGGIVPTKRRLDLEGGYITAMFDGSSELLQLLL